MDRKTVCQWIADFVTSLALREGTGYCSFWIDQIGLFR